MPVNDAPIPVKPVRGLPPGFTMIEIVVVMVLMSIVTAVVLGRSITTSEVDVVGQTDKIRNHLRYAQAIAMKRSDTVWGVEFPAGQYAFFSGTGQAKQQLLLPGGEYSGGDTFIKYSDLGISITMSGLPQPNTSSIIFDHFGRPYSAYTDASNNTPLTSPVNITVSASGSTRIILIEPETGFIR